MKEEIQIVPADRSDFDEIWKIFQPVIAKGDTYAFYPDSKKEDMEAYWLGKDKKTFKAVIDGEIVGSYIIKDNQPGLGSHVSNAGFMVHPEQNGIGIGKAMGEHALIEAKKLGYKAMQFNFVISTNTRAVKLWKSLGFEVLGQIPEAYNHSQLGLVDAYIMHRFL